jgi:hypothetical protein
VRIGVIKVSPLTTARHIGERDNGVGWIAMGLDKNGVWKGV